MAKFVLYPEHGMSLREYEGDFMKMNKEFVEIWKNLSGDKAELVASIRLDKGHSVVKEEDKKKR